MIRALLALLLFAASCAGAEERIRRYDIEVQVWRDGHIDVTEHITVRAEGEQIRRGIYRDFPTRYRDRYGNRVEVALEVLEVLRNGAPEPWFTERLSNGVRINTGNDDFLPVPREHTFTLRYRTTRQLGFFADHDELYWNAIGTGWVFPIDAGTAVVRLPEPVPVVRMRAEGYTGYQGETGQAFRAWLPAPGEARWELGAGLEPAQGFTLVLSFPKGIVAEPGVLDRMRWLLQDNLGVLIGLTGLGLLLVYCVREWRRVGRDPDPGIIIPRYEPPAGHTPASLRYLRRMRYDMRCFSSEVLSLAVAGCLRIERDKKFFGEEWQLQRAEGKPDSLSAAQRALLEHLFTGGKNVLVLKDDNAATVSAAREVHLKALDRALQPRFFKSNGASFAVACIITAVFAVIAFLASGGNGIPALLALGFIAFVVLAAFRILVHAPTAEGRALLDEVEGLKLYLGVAERDELARMPGPDAPPLLDAGRYEELLPFAVALEVEDAWTKKFTAAVGAAAAAEAGRHIHWYRGDGFRDLEGMSRALGQSLTSEIASSASPPGSSSGSGGGGSSGGGGGGGGGGGR